MDNTVYFTVAEHQGRAVITFQCPACNKDNTLPGDVAPAAAKCARCFAWVKNANR